MPRLILVFLEAFSNQPLGTAKIELAFRMTDFPVSGLS
jgi:hypothetical protein